MTLIRRNRPATIWKSSDPFTSFNRMFENVFDRDFSGVPTNWGESLGGDMKVNVSETDKTFEVLADLPGVKKENIDISVEGNLLTIKAERKEEKEEKEKNFHRQEILFGSFERSISLPDHVDVEKIHAELKDGHLSVELPKSEASIRKTIQIKG